jgi:hypothetical protein
MSEEDNNNLAIQIVNIFKNGVQTQTQNPKPNPSDSLKINLNLTSQNYMLNNLTQDPPEPIDEQWEQDDLIVFS